MRIRNFTAHVVRLALKHSFRHASASRECSENILVRCELMDGTVGWGEGVPRPYVTGETPEGCVAQLAATEIGAQLGDDCDHWSEVVALCGRFEPQGERDDPRGCNGNALRCAVELSILDAYGQLFGESVQNVSRYVPWAAPVMNFSNAVYYSAVIDAGSHSLWRKTLVRRLYGFRDCKVKVGAINDDDVARVATIRKWAGPSMDLRVDANEAWHVEEVEARIRALSPFNLSCVEQPVPHAEVGGLTDVRPRIGVPVMLDESLTSVVDAKAAIEGKTCDLFNIRLSKCGGFLNSLRLAAMAHEAGLGYQLGCHPGESGILSAAGRQWACSVRDIRYCEGSYDHHILKQNITNEDMTFGYRGRGKVITGPGLGVTVNEALLRDCAIQSQRFDIG